ncbi:MAG: hypothetical protein ABSG71_21760 [Thermodesulfobacteriota bacterium]|jgi:hypothetical protein
MAKIIFTMSNGEKYTLSSGLVTRGKPINNEDEVRSELNYILENLLFFVADDGCFIVPKHISSARFER